MLKKHESYIYGHYISNLKKTKKPSQVFKDSCNLPEPQPSPENT